MGDRSLEIEGHIALDGDFSRFDPQRGGKKSPSIRPRKKSIHSR